MQQAHYNERRIPAPVGFRNQCYYQRYVAAMRNARRALERNDLARADYRVADALVWLRLSKMGEQS